MYSNEILELAAASKDTSMMIRLSLDKINRQKIIEATAFMDSFYPKIPLKIRCIAIIQSYNESNFPKCKNCDSPVGYDKEYNNSFNTFCSDKCAKDYGRLPDDIRGKLNDPDWLYQKRIHDRMPYQTIADELGVSDYKVKSACIALGIPLLRYNESTSEVLVKLQDKEFLEAEYSKGKTMQQISEEIKSSKATVQKSFIFHEITVRPPNSYARKVNKRSKEEVELEEYIKSLGVVTEHSNRKILNGLEIDILCPELNIGFEYNGIYSHLEENGKGAKYHITKTELAAAAGIKLFHIFSDDWILNKDVMKSVISSKLGKAITTLHARKCSISSLSANDKNLFLDSNHIQGKDSSSINYALSFDGMPVAIMTFGKSRYNKSTEWELIRFACKKNTSVVGGFSKLLCEFRKNNSGSIVSYADRSISDGGVYSKNGFALTRVNPPNYKYVNLNKGLKRLHRAAFMKGKISDDGDTRSEREIMLSRGYKRIWDCGTLTYIMQ
jgi:hypothetical protein